MLKTTAHQTAMLARPRFTCLGTVARANRRAARDVTRLYRRMNVAHVTQQSRWACETVRQVSRSACFGDVVHSFCRSVIVVSGRPRRRRHRHHRRRCRRHRRRRCRRRRRRGGRARRNPRTPFINSLTSRVYFAVNATRCATLCGRYLLPCTLRDDGDIRAFRHVRETRKNDTRSTPDTRLARANTRAPTDRGGSGVTLRHLLLRSFSVTWIDAARARMRALLPLLPVSRLTSHVCRSYALLFTFASARARHAPTRS